MTINAEFLPQLQFYCTTQKEQQVQFSLKSVALSRGGVSDGQPVGGNGSNGGWRDEGRCIVLQKLPMLASQCGYVMRARDTHTHTHT